MIKFNVRFQFNFLNIFNENVKVFSKHAHSYFDDGLKNIDILISESQDWINQKKDIKLNFDLPYVFNLNKNIKAFSKQAHTYFDERLSFISEKLDISNIKNKNLKFFSKYAFTYVDEHVKIIDIFISEKQDWLSQKKVTFTNLIKQNQVISKKKLVLLDNKRAGFILDKLNKFNFINNNSNFPPVFLVKFIRKLLELIVLSRLISFFKKKFYSLELTQIRIVRAPPFE